MKKNIVKINENTLRHMENPLPFHTYVVAVHSDYYTVERIRFKPTKMPLKQFARSKYYQIVDKYGYPFEIYVDGSKTPVPYPIPHHRERKTMTVNEEQLRKIIREVISEAIGEEGIHIKEKNRGKFNATKERTGQSTEELTHSKNPLTRKRAVFAQNAKNWNKKK